MSGDLLEMTSVVLTYHTYKDNFIIKHKSAKNLKESSISVLINNSPSNEYFPSIAVLAAMGMRQLQNPNP